ncbi:BRO-N domain-containing protein [Xanthomonas sp. WHRI 7945]|nr:Bro-N domain-containing protein [Xanthomonas campestris pv. campestris]
MNVIPFQFQSISIRAVQIDGAPWFVGKDIAEALGYVNAADALAKHCKGVAKRYPLQTAGGMQEVRIISEPDLYRLVANSQLPEAERFERWVFEEVLPTIRKTGDYGYGAGLRQLTGYVGDGCMLIESMSRTLNLAPSSTLGMYQKLGEKTGHTDLLPAYAIDGNDSGGSEPTAALQTLLKQHNAPVGVQRTYALLETRGLVERRSRPSSSRGTKQFWTITAAGAQYGKNITAPANPRETQPHFYTEKFPQLLQMLAEKIAA